MIYLASLYSNGFSKLGGSKVKELYVYRNRK